jgi:hypothetical protein
VKDETSATQVLHFYLREAQDVEPNTLAEKVMTNVWEEKI